MIAVRRWFRLPAGRAGGFKLVGASVAALSLCPLGPACAPKTIASPPPAASAAPIASAGAPSGPVQSEAGSVREILDGHHAVTNPLLLRDVIAARCAEDVAACRGLFESPLEDQQALAVRLALCGAGLGSACRWASVQVSTDPTSGAEAGAWHRELMTRGCTLGDAPTCALLGASLALEAAAGSPAARQAETHLKRGCQDARHPCHKLVAPGDLPQERVTEGRILVDPRYPLLRAAACAVAHDPSACRELEEDGMPTTVDLPWPRREVAEGQCQGGLVAGCQALLAEHGNQKLPEAACRAGVAGACEALSTWGDDEKAQLPWARRACRLGRCAACFVIAGAEDIKPYLEDLNGACYAGCRDECSHLGEAYSTGMQGVRIDEQRGALYRTLAVQ